ARLQVGGTEQLRLVQVTAGPVVAKLTDANGLLYPGVRILASGDGSITPASAVTGADGLVTFDWRPAAMSQNELRLMVEAIPAVSLTLHAGLSVPAIGHVVDAASNESG